MTLILTRLLPRRYKISAMRRLFILFLLCLLPLQISWAAVGDYCGHEQDNAAQHFGHHDDAHEPSPSPSDDGKQDAQSFGHGHCHLSGFLGVLSTFADTAHECVHPRPHEGEGTYQSRPTCPPERPQWTRPA